MERRDAEAWAKAAAERAALLTVASLYVTVGGALSGLLLGAALDIFLVSPDGPLDVSDGEALLVAPAVLAAVLGGAGGLLSGKNGAAGSVVTALLAKPTKSLVEGTASAIVDEVKSIPSKAAKSVDTAVDDTVDEVKILPSKAAKAVETAVDEAVNEVKSIPSK